VGENELFIPTIALLPPVQSQQQRQPHVSAANVEEGRAPGAEASRSGRGSYRLLRWEVVVVEGTAGCCSRENLRLLGACGCGCQRGAARRDAPPPSPCLQ
jgi:hypothetical protein